MRKKRRFTYLGLALVSALVVALVVLIPAMGIGQTSLPSPSSISADNTVSNAGSFLTSNCMECHNDSTLIAGKKTAWEESLHATGEAAFYAGFRAGCSACHSGGGFSASVAKGQDPVHPDPNNPILADPNPSHIDCRTCHQIHETYTGSDFALETTAPVSLIQSGKTFDGGKGNLCARCHQARTAAPVPSNGTIKVTSVHWGPHHGPQSQMLLGTGGSGPAGEGSPAPHYSAVENTCAKCHMGDPGTQGKFGVNLEPTGNHSFNPNVATCKGCHTGATNFDINGKQTAVQAKLDTLEGLLVAAGALECTGEDCHPKVGTYPENVGSALWNWILIAKEDKSKGVHNANYTNALLDASIAGMGG